MEKHLAFSSDCAVRRLPGLSAEGGEGRLVLGVDGTATGTAALLGAGTAGGTTGTTTLTTATSTAAATAATTLATTTTGTTTAAVTSVRGGVVLAVQGKSVLGLVLLGAVLLAGGTGEVLLLHTLDGLALRELLAGTLVGLADGEAVATESLALLGEVGKVLVVGLALVLLGLGSGSRTVRAGAESRVGGASVGSEASLVLSLGGSNSVTSLLVVPLGLALLVTPAVTGLLLVLA